MRAVRARPQAHPTKALLAPPALGSWEHPRKMRPRAHSKKAPAGSRAECWSEVFPFPNRSRVDRALERPAAQRPTKALPAPLAALPRRAAIPRLAPAVKAPRLVVAAARPALEAAAPAP